jgi:hypothetical protein
LSRLTGSQEELWALVEPLIPAGRVDKAAYAFQDLWEAAHGTV